MCDVPGALGRSTATSLARGGFCLGWGGGGVGWLTGVRPALPLRWGLIWGILLWVWLAFLLKETEDLVVLMASLLSLWVGLQCEVGSRSLWHPDLPQGFSENFKFFLACCTKGWKGHVAPLFFFFLVTFWSNCLTICNHGVCLPACFLCFATAEVGGSGVTAAFLYCMAVPSISPQNSEILCGRVLLLHYLCGRISWAFLFVVVLWQSMQKEVCVVQNTSCLSMDSNEEHCHWHWMRRKRFKYKWTATEDSRSCFVWFLWLRWPYHSNESCPTTVEAVEFGSPIITADVAHPGPRERGALGESRVEIVTYTWSSCYTMQPVTLPTWSQKIFVISGKRIRFKVALNRSLYPLKSGIWTSGTQAIGNSPILASYRLFDKQEWNLAGDETAVTMVRPTLWILLFASVS